MKIRPLKLRMVEIPLVLKPQLLDFILDQHPASAEPVRDTFTKKILIFITKNLQWSAIIFCFDC